MKVATDGFEFTFTDAISAFVFDETDKSKPTFHGAPMKAVDIVAEFENDYVFIELKDYDDLDTFDIRIETAEEENKARLDSFRWLKNYLKYKYRDTFLYRFAEEKVNKPIRYLCVVNFDNALNSRLQKSLKAELPIGKVSSRWEKAIAQSCHVLNLTKWNEVFPKWPLTRLYDATKVLPIETGAAN